MGAWRGVRGEGLLGRILLSVLVLVVLAPWVALAQEAASSPDPGVDAEAWMVWVVVALAVSEALALMPWFKSNGILHGLILLLRKLTGRSVVPAVALVMIGVAGCTAAGRQAIAQFRADLRTVLVAGCEPDEAIELTAEEVLRTLPPGTTLDAATKRLEVAEASGEALCALVDAARAARAQPARQP